MCLVGFRKVSNWNEIMIIHIVEGTVGWLAGVGLSRLWVAGAGQPYWIYTGRGRGGGMAICHEVTG
jgi:hypothetical protein